MQYWLGDSETNVQVKWYRSRDEQIAGRIEGENIKHTDISGQTTVKTNSVTTMQYGLQIKNFSNSDIGYYWCQMVVNNTALPPSPYGYIHSPQCSLTETTCNVRSQPLCAQNLTVGLCHMAMTEQNGMNCTIEAITYNEITTQSTSERVTSIKSMTEAMDNNLSSIGISIGILLFIVLLVIALTILLFFTLKFMKGKKRGKYYKISRHRIIVILHHFWFDL